MLLRVLELCVHALLVLVRGILKLLVELLLLVGERLLRLICVLLGLRLELIGVLLGLGRDVLLKLVRRALELRTVLLKGRGLCCGRL